MTVAIIGSGPAAFASALALRDLGINFVVVDIGAAPSPETQEVIKAAVSQLKAGQRGLNIRITPKGSTTKADKGSIGQKTFFGDSFSYDETNSISFENTRTRRSRAFGGFSTVWGATMLPFQASHLEFWEDADALRSAYRRIQSVVPVVGGIDNYENYGPLGELPIRGSMVENSSKKLKRIKSIDYQCGDMRLAVEVGKSEKSCRECGSCIEGCPFGSIWSSGRGWREVVRLDHHEYIGNVEVEELIEAGGRVQLHGMRREEEWVEVFDGVIVAAGPIGTSSLLLKSGLIDAIDIADSQTVFWPGVCFAARPSLKPGRKTSFTLSHSYLDVESRALKDKIHLQLYGWNSSIPQRLENMFSFTRFAPKSLLAFLTQYVCNAILYFGENDSGSLTVTIDEKGVSVVANDAKVRKAQKTQMKRISRVLRKNGIFLFRSVAQFATVGEGYHLGHGVGRKQVESFSFAELEGKMVGCSRIYVVDSLTLPILPSGPMTFTMMANAYRLTKKNFESKS